MNHLLMKKRAFMAIANQIKGIKATKTGTFPVTLPGCVDNDCAVGYKIYGNTVTGKNLIPYPYVETTKTVNGVTFTDNGDGSITVPSQQK